MFLISEKFLIDKKKARKVSSTFFIIYYYDKFNYWDFEGFYKIDKINKKDFKKVFDSYEYSNIKVLKNSYLKNISSNKGVNVYRMEQIERY